MSSEFEDPESVASVMLGAPEVVGAVVSITNALLTARLLLGSGIPGSVITFPAVSLTVPGNELTVRSEDVSPA